LHLTEGLIPPLDLQADSLSCHVSAVPGLYCIVNRRSVESVGGVFDPIVSTATAVFEHVKEKIAVIPCLPQDLATL